MSTPDNAIAVVGMAGRFPGANDLSTFWSNLRRGKESIVTLSEQELRDAGVSDKTLADPAYVRRAPLLDGIDEFDAEFFGFPPLAAQVLDPQHRLFLQCAWHALEDAGCDPAQFDGSIGVYGTSSPSGYLLHNLLSHRDPNAVLAEGLNFDQFSLFLQNDKDFLATRISHAFNLRGPSIAVQTACSSSLVAVHLACLSLLSGECDMALAGGSSLCIPHRVGYWNSPGSMVSAVGHCRPFDVRADGTVFGSGVAMVALKPLQAAIDAGDRIHAVIRGSAINNDGSAKMGYAAPNPAAQADVIAEAHAVAGIDSSTVSYVECHGTGTPLGDPIEIQGLRTAFEVSDTPRPGPCVLGSVKSNIGHLEVAAGIAGLIKTILCLKHEAIPATLHYTSPNPELRLDQSPFVVQNKYGPWEWDGVLRAGVSSFGVGGTNAHVVLEQAPAQAPPVPAHTGPQVLLLSAKTTAALRESRDALASALERPDSPDVADVAYTLTRRRKHNVSMAAVVHDREHAVKVLRAAEHDNVFLGESGTGDAPEPTTAPDRVVFLFPGQGAQHVGMAKGLYDTEAVFAEHFDSCAAGFRDAMGIDLHAEVFGGTATDLERIDRSQPALFTVEYALAKLVDSYGVRAGAYIGYSTGEYIAATLAGVFDVETAIKTVALRARLMHESPPGAMVAVAVGPDDVAQYLSPGVELSAVNDPGNCVVAGPKDAIREFSQRLNEAGIPVRRVRATHAFHTSSMDPMLEEFQGFLSRQQLRAPRTPLLSNLTGTWLTEQQVTDPATWTRQISSPIRFADELDVVLTDPGRVLVEVGPGGSLTGSAIRHPKWSAGHRSVRLMRHPIQNADDRDTFLRALGELWSAGIEIDWTPRRTGQPQLASLPGYPFARQRHWVEPKHTVRVQVPAGSNGSSVGVRAASETGTAAEASGSGESQTEITLRRIWEQCMGVSCIDRNANFFDMGGDSLMAISIAMSAANEGLTITPQDLYEYPTLAALSAAVDASFAASGLAKPAGAQAHPAVPPNIAYFLDRGLRDTGRWRVPLILRLDPKIATEDVRAVLTAVANHHDALRLHIVDTAGMWEQHIAGPAEFTRLSTASLPDEVSAGSPQERAAVSAIVAELAARQDLSDAPLSAVHITAGHGGHHFLGLSLHETVSDDASLQILGSDIITAFGRRLAGEEIALEPVTTGWRDWSVRCAALATHPAALDTRSFWIENSGKVTLWLTDAAAAAEHPQPPGADDLIKSSTTLSFEQTSELDDARRRFRRSIQEIVLAGLGRTIAKTVGEGVLAVELEGEGRSVLRPDVDLRRTVGWFTTYYPIPLACVNGPGAAAIAQLDAVHDTLKSVPHYGIGYGLLRYLYAPTGRVLGAQRTPDIHFRYAGVIPELPGTDAPVQFDSDMTMPVRESIPGLGHAIELRAYRFGGSLHLDWWYDSRRIPAATAAALVQNFPAALSELIQEAIAAEHDESEDVGAPEAGALVDLSSLDAG